MTQQNNTPFAWWLPVELAEHQCWHVNIGLLSLYLSRQPQQWLLAYEQLSPTEHREQLSSAAALCIPPGLTAERYMFRQSPGSFCLTPLLPDRPVVVKTLQPLHIPPGEQITLYISSPVTVRAALRQPDCPLQDIAVTRLSDTWFGPSTQLGELCYADKTHARFSKDELPKRPHRAITPVHIHNSSRQLLSLNKLSIPVPYLAVYSSADGNLWTDPISLQHESAAGLTRFKTGQLSTAELGSMTQLSPPRAAPDKHNLIRAFTHMFTD